VTASTSISIITVALNSAKHIRGAMESVIAQELDDLQYIVIDGLSDDDTVAIAESYRQRLGDRLVVVSERDSGLYDAMNKGIALATGDVIGILNSDDRYLPGALRAVEQAFAAGGVDIAYGNVEMVDDDGTWIHRPTLDGMRERMTLGHPACFVRRAAYDRWGAFDTRYRFNADYDFLLRCQLQGARFVHVDRTLAEFHSGGLSSGSFDRRRREVHDIHRRHLGRVHAAWCQARIIAGVWRSRARRALGIALLGSRRYERISASRRRRSRG
jgi:glycosyltransferase involved in cell wall biosynthesis